MVTRSNYDPDAYEGMCGMFRVLLAWHATMLPSVLSSGFFWITMILHVVLHVINFTLSLNRSRLSDGMNATDTKAALARIIIVGEDDGPTGLPAVSWSVGTVALSLCFFFLCFYLNQMYARYQGFYGNVVGIGGQTMVWVGYCRMHLGSNQDPRQPVRHWNAVRYVLAASQVFYCTRLPPEPNALGISACLLDLP